MNGGQNGIDRDKCALTESLGGEGHENALALVTDRDDFHSIFQCCGDVFITVDIQQVFSCEETVILSDVQCDGGIFAAIQRGCGLHGSDDRNLMFDAAAAADNGYFNAHSARSFMCSV